jgi:hypothetical protein
MRSQIFVSGCRRRWRRGRGETVPSKRNGSGERLVILRIRWKNEAQGVDRIGEAGEAAVVGSPPLGHGHVVPGVALADAVSPET